MPIGGQLWAAQQGGLVFCPELRACASRIFRDCVRYPLRPAGPALVGAHPMSRRPPPWVEAQGDGALESLGILLPLCSPCAPPGSAAADDFHLTPGSEQKGHALEARSVSGGWLLMVSSVWGPEVPSPSTLPTTHTCTHSAHTHAHLTPTSGAHTHMHSSRPCRSTCTPVHICVRTYNSHHLHPRAFHTDAHEHMYTYVHS